MTHFFSDLDGHLFCEGTHYRTYEKMGAHVTEVDGEQGTHFAVWAPAARQVSVIGNFNQWDAKAHPMQVNRDTGIWTRFIPGVTDGALYKYFVDSQFDYKFDKSDPYAFAAEIVPQTASRVCTLAGYEWKDQDWMANRKKYQSLDSPISIYEVHLGSWRRPGEDPKKFPTYRQIAPELIDYVQRTGYTHVEFMPLMEHPFYGSWGYQTVGYYAPTSRYGSPHDLMFLIDSLHQAGIGVILDWVPSHFPQDGHGLVYFDGTHLYEHADPRQGIQPDWGTYVYNYGRKEVRSFLISNAFFWYDQYHVDGLRLDAVASMLYLDYSRKDGQWVANRYGGRENLEAIEFLRQFNTEVHAEFDDVLTIAEESTAWPMVSRPVYLGGLGFSLKWNMGWMHDVLDYMKQDPIHRNYHHGKMTFGIMYAFSENFILSFSHDEVVHLKRSMLGKMPGDLWKQLANLRLLYGFMMAHPGKKLLFMGQDFGQWAEWNHDKALDWQLLEHESHSGLHRWVADLNHMYRNTPALYEIDFDWKGFQWVDCNDHERSILSFLRFGNDPNLAVLCVCNFTPIPRYNYRIGVPWGGNWQEVLNSDAATYGGSGAGNLGSVVATDESCHGRPCSLDLTLPPLAVLYFRGERPPEAEGDRKNEFGELEMENEAGSPADAEMSGDSTKEEP